MCGIFAVTGPDDQAGSQVLKGLKTLEYRGYDSWGVAVRSADAKRIIVTKDTGKISDVQVPFPKGYEAIGHTRWATHGGVTVANSHPHQVGKVTLVHNGIFENYAEYKKKFLASGTVFKSDTDSEVIAHLINELLNKGIAPAEAIRKACGEIKGRFSLLMMFIDVPGIFAARRGSPLILGRGKEQTFIASDIPAFLEKTRLVNYLDDNEMVFIRGNTVQFCDLNSGEPITKRDIEVPWKVEHAEKGEYQHFMLKEIFDQKDSIARAINHEDEVLNKAVELLKSSNGTYLVACGTAHKVCLAAEYFFSRISGRKINVVAASEAPYFERFINQRTAMVAVSQSGETADILEVFERAKARGAKLLSLTNVESSSVSRMSDVHLPINAGPEKAVASTKATTAQMALLLLLAHTDAGKTNQGRELLSITSSAINDLLNPRYEEHIQAVAAKYVNQPNLFIIGRGPLYPIALEAAIKIQEVSYIHAQGFAAGEIKHGPLALIEEGVPCLVLGDDLETISNAIELKTRGAQIIGVSSENADIFDHWIKVPDAGEAQAIATLIPVQIFSYHLALLRNLDPDMPRNLAKSVTVK